MTSPGAAHGRRAARATRPRCASPGRGRGPGRRRPDAEPARSSVRQTSSWRRRPGGRPRSASTAASVRCERARRRPSTAAGPRGGASGTGLGAQAAEDEVEHGVGGQLHGVEDRGREDLEPGPVEVVGHGHPAAAVAGSATSRARPHPSVGLAPGAVHRSGRRGRPGHGRWRTSPAGRSRRGRRRGRSSRSRRARRACGERPPPPRAASGRRRGERRSRPESSPGGVALIAATHAASRGAPGRLGEQAGLVAQGVSEREEVDVVQEAEQAEDDVEREPVEAGLGLGHARPGGGVGRGRARPGSERSSRRRRGCGRPGCSRRWARRGRPGPSAAAGVAVGTAARR